MHGKLILCVIINVILLLWQIYVESAIGLKCLIAKLISFELIGLTAFPGDAMNTPLLSSMDFSVDFCNEISDSALLLKGQCITVKSSSLRDGLVFEVSST